MKEKVKAKAKDAAAPTPYEMTKIREIPVAKLVKADWNYKEDDEFRAAQLQENLKRNGQIVNIVVRKLSTGYYEVLDGNHRLDAIKGLGWASAFCYDLGVVSDARARRISVEINETRFTTNIVRLAEVIGEIKEEFSLDDLLTTLPFTPEELEAFAEMKKFDWESGQGPDTSGGLASEKVKMEFMLTKDQAKVVNDALVRIVVGLKLEGEWRMSRALELIAADSMGTTLESYQ
jgi:hypothetical protein